MSTRNLRERPQGAPRTVLLLLLLVLLAAIPRLAQLPAMRETNMEPDTAHFLNVARCLERGQGLSNPAAWPAWLRPARLPMPDTWKEPAYPWLIATLARAGIDPFRAGQAISLVAGLLLPLAVWLLARQVVADPRVAWLAALMVAGSPELIDKAVSALSESLFTLFVTLAFLCAAWRLRDEPRRRTWRADALAGALFGACLLLRSQAALALPALAVLMLWGRPWRRFLAAGAVAGVAALVVLSPYIARNLRLFGVPFHSDAPLSAMWAYGDPIMLSHGLDRPAAFAGFAVRHPLEVLTHFLRGAWLFARAVLPFQLLGNPLWALAAVLGLEAVRRSWRVGWFAVLHIGLTVGLVLSISWEGRYFASTVPAWCLLAAVGANRAARALDRRWAAGANRTVPPLVATALLALAAIGPLVAVLRQPSRMSPPHFEIAAARAYAPWLRARLAPDEAVMVVMTSYWAWFVDRPVVTLVIADSTQFLEEVRRLKVRWAVLPTEALPARIARYPDRRLPRALVVEGRDPALGVTVYRVDPGGAAP